MNALDAANVFLPSGDAKIGKLDYVLDSNSMYRDIRDMGDIPLRYENGRAVFLRDVATPHGRQLHPDQRGPRQRQARGLYSGVSPAWCEHAGGGHQAQGSP